MEHKLEVLQFFSYEHLPGRLQPASKIFAEMAASMLLLCPTGSAQRTIALNKLLEAKDAFVRACIIDAKAGE